MTQKLPRIEKRISPPTDWNKTQPKDISDTVTYGTYEESLRSFDAILSKRKPLQRQFTEALAKVVANEIRSAIDQCKGNSQVQLSLDL